VTLKKIILFQAAVKVVGKEGCPTGELLAYLIPGSPAPEVCISRLLNRTLEFDRTSEPSAKNTKDWVRLWITL